MRDRARAFLGRPFDATAGPGIGALGSLTDPRMFGDANAAVRNDRVQFWMKQAIEAVRALESGFPGSAYLPQLKFLVADAYMRADQVSDAKLWLEAVYREAKAESFWSHVARLRLGR
jgi:predicted negative regulator of RcsB-dependent stress response